MQKPIVTGLMAYGMSGKIFHAPFISTSPAFTFKGVVERNEKRAFKDYPSAISYNTINELLNDDEVELVIVNTPNNTHFDFAKQALLAGKHVLIEKPAATSVKEVKQLFDLGRTQNKKVLIYQNRRWSSDFISTKQIIDGGKLGDIIEVHLRFDRYRSTIGPKSFKETPVPGSGILYDLGSHLIDQAISLFGKPQSSYKIAGRYRPNSQVIDYAALHLQYANQLNVFITVSLLVASPLPGIVIHGTKGSFIKQFCDTQELQLMSGLLPTDDGFGKELINMEGQLTTVNEEGEKYTALIPSSKGVYTELFEAVYESIRNNTDFPVKEDEILSQIELLEQANG